MTARSIYLIQKQYVLTQDCTLCGPLVNLIFFSKIHLHHRDISIELLYILIKQFPLLIK